jgi:hypothetical protein
MNQAAQELHLGGPRKRLGKVNLDQRLREFLLAANDLEAVALQLVPARAGALVSQRLSLYDQATKRIGELLDLHVRSLSFPARFGHADSVYLGVRLALIEACW